MSDEEHFLIKQTKELALPLGEAIWAFSRIERMSFTYLKALSTEPLDKFMEGVSLRGRLSVIAHLVDRIEGKDEAKALALKCIKSATSLSNTRNLIAHNPWAITVDFDKNQFLYNIEKITKKSINVDLQGLKNFTEECETLYDDFETALVTFITNK